MNAGISQRCAYLYPIVQLIGQCLIKGLIVLFVEIVVVAQALYIIDIIVVYSAVIFSSKHGQRGTRLGVEKLFILDYVPLNVIAIGKISEGYPLCQQRVYGCEHSLAAFKFRAQGLDKALYAVGRIRINFVSAYSKNSVAELKCIGVVDLDRKLMHIRSRLICTTVIIQLFMPRLDKRLIDQQIGEFSILVLCITVDNSKRLIY